MLNTGLSLRKPFESDYGAFMRFLISNPGLSKQILSECLKRYVKSGEFHHPGYQAVLALRHEMEFCQKNHISFVAPTSVFDHEVRNCWKCAAIGYHSYFYQWRWIDRCPIHHEKITRICRKCGKSWPKLHEVINRTCETCGARSSRNRIQELSGFVNHHEYNVLDSFNNLDIEYNRSKRLHLISKRAINSPLALGDHWCVPIDNYYFPSVAKNQLSSSFSKLKYINSRPQKSIKLTFYSINEGRSYGKLEVMSDEQKTEIRDKVVRKIHRAFSDATGNTHSIKFQNDIDLQGISSKTNIYAFAFTVWLSVVREIPSRKRSRPLGWRYFQTSLGEDLPLIPAPMDSYSIIEKNQTTKPTPLALQLAVYEIDLWCCYKSILKYFDVLKRNTERSNYRYFLEDLPFWAYPGRPYNEEISAFLMNDNKIELIVPQSTINTSFKELGLQE